ncbi:larval cuticle protein 65Ag1-like [Drosophila tropicalis]|uniref:Uncharacterized protein n=1 Tax=Drosophila willistoni TaxID=7260 RepID=B4MKZ7_DROWI|nr:larval cuticle protein 65Ag1 [Drosophila willistoni]EDW72922.1 uncharacterized protein Dwil_GK16922 [Drosophila willistoni]
MKFAIVFVALFGLALAAPASSSDQAAETVRQEADVHAEGYNFNYETSNGISGQATGELKTLGPEESAVVSKGSYSYTDPEGHQHTITYVADENGFQPQGEDIPVAPVA